MSPDRTAPYVPGFDYNVFVSYAHADDGDGWVTSLYKFLDRRIGELLGRDSIVWRDPQLRPGHTLDSTLGAKIDGSAVLLSVLSPNYVNSSYCPREVDRFRRGGRPLLVDGASRWIRIVKTPYDPGAAPAELSESEETIESRFVRVNRDSKLIEEFEPGSPEFNQQANLLAQSIVQLLQKMQRSAAPPPSPEAVRVFLAATASDRASDRKFIHEELGNDVDAPSFPLDELSLAELEAEIERSLRGVTLSIHVLGARYGVIPDGAGTRSLPRIQFEAASKVPRLVWIPQELTGVDEAQQAFIDEIEELSDDRLEVLRTGRQDFLQHARDVIERLSKPVFEPAIGAAVYLVHQLEDLERPQLQAIRDCIMRRGFLVEYPAFQGALTTLADLEKQALQDTSATVIYFGTADDSWVISRRKEILKRLGELQLAPQHRRAVYLCDPLTPIKRVQYMSVPDRQLPERGGPPLLVLGDCGPVECRKLDPLLGPLVTKLAGRANG